MQIRGSTVSGWLELKNRGKDEFDINNLEFASKNQVRPTVKVCFLATNFPIHMIAAKKRINSQDSPPPSVGAD